MDFALPPDVTQLLAEIDRFIAAEILPLQGQDDNERFFRWRNARRSS